MAVDQVGRPWRSPSSPAGRPPMPSAHEERPARSHLVEPDLGVKAGVPVLRSATRKGSSLCPALRPRSVLPKTETWTAPRHTAPQKTGSDGESHSAVPSDDPIRDEKFDESRDAPEERPTSACRKSQSSVYLAAMTPISRHRLAASARPPPRRRLLPGRHRPATAVPTPAAGTPADSVASVPELPAMQPYAARSRCM